MHEYSLMQNVIESILNQLEAEPLEPTEKIKGLVLKVGALDIHSKESFCQSFQMLVKETPLENCELTLEIEPGTLECHHCGYEGPCPSDQGDGHDALPVAECPGCSRIIHITGGRGIRTVDLVM